MHILAVDDERAALEALIGELKSVFPEEEIHGEKKPSEAIIWAKALLESKNALDYAFLDIQLRNANGIELARQLKELFPEVRLIFCTAYSEYAFDAFGLYAKGYLLKPILASDIVKVLNEMVADWKSSPSPLERDIKICTFGNFEVFIDGEILTFEREKAKELFAFLVDRRGTSVTTKEIAGVLWEDMPYDSSTKNMVTTIVASLKKTLKEVGIEDILIKTWNHLAIDITKIKCDAYDYENLDAAAINSFRGEYMAQYSWAEFTTGKYTRIRDEE